MRGEEQYRCPSTSLQPRQGRAAPLAVSTPCPQKQQPHSNCGLPLGESRSSPSQPEVKTGWGRVFGNRSTCLIAKAVVFPVVMYGCESWTITKAVQFSSVPQLCPTLCDPMNHSTPGLPFHHQLPESTQTHVHRVGDAIRPLSFPSSPAPNPSQHQSLFQ